MSNLIGQRLGQYEIISLLGRGGMATVYRARQSSVNREVAVKIITPELASGGPDFVTRFEREAQTVANLSHPHILRVFDYGREGSMVYLAMELLRGGSLADLVSKGPLPLSDAMRMLDQIGSALDYAHRNGIIHRDMKPQNVLLDDSGNAYLTDFGIAKILSDANTLTQTGAAIGTPSYMSPEQWQGLPLDSRTDIYALGIVLYEMLAGHTPFTADTPASMMFKHLQALPPSLTTARAEVSHQADSVIDRALAKNPLDRYGSA